MKSASVSRRSAALVAVAVATASLLQGCDVPHVEGYIVVGNFDVETHHVPMWRRAKDYFESNSYQDPMTKSVEFNSCMNPSLTVVSVCGGHGKCLPFDPDNTENPTFFCFCDPAWAGLECNHKRKSQLVTWLLSLFFGPLALDELYLHQEEQ